MEIADCGRPGEGRGGTGSRAIFEAGIDTDSVTETKREMVEGERRLLDFCYAYDPRHAELLVYYDSWEVATSLSLSL